MTTLICGIFIFKMNNQQEPTVQHRELCSMLCASLDGRGAWGRMDTCICLAESLCCSPETITTLLISCESESRSVVSDSLQSHGLYSPWNSPGQTTGVGNLSLLQGILPTQGLNPDLMQVDSLPAEPQGSPRILEWVAYSFSRESSQSRNQTGFFCIAGRFFTN